jgi:hypothetical protein
MWHSALMQFQVRTPVVGLPYLRSWFAVMLADKRGFSLVAQGQ